MGFSLVVFRSARCCSGPRWTAIVLLLAGAGVSGGSRLSAARTPQGKGDEAEPAGGADRVESLPLAVDARRLDLLAEAQRCRERGDYGRAIIFLFSHQLLQLDKHGRIRLARGKTNRQYLREIRPVAVRSAGWSSRRR